jgi:hypothetical protein
MAKRGVYRFFSKGPYGICPDCGETTFVRTGTLLGDVLQERPILSEGTLDRIIDDIFDWAQRCIKCKSQAETSLFWIQLGPDIIGGPFCAGHFSDEVAYALGGEGDLDKDAPCYQVRFNKETRAILDSFEVDEEVEEEEPEGRELLDPALLF